MVNNQKVATRRDCGWFYHRRVLSRTRPSPACAGVLPWPVRSDKGGLPNRMGVGPPGRVPPWESSSIQSIAPSTVRLTGSKVSRRLRKAASRACRMRERCLRITEDMIRSFARAIEEAEKALKPHIESLSSNAVKSERRRRTRRRRKERIQTGKLVKAANRRPKPPKPEQATESKPGGTSSTTSVDANLATYNRQGERPVGVRPWVYPAPFQICEWCGDLWYFDDSRSLKRNRRHINYRRVHEVVEDAWTRCIHALASDDSDNTVSSKCRWIVSNYSIVTNFEVVLSNQTLFSRLLEEWSCKQGMFAEGASDFVMPDRCETYPVLEEVIWSLKPPGNSEQVENSPTHCGATQSPLPKQVRWERRLDPPAREARKLFPDSYAYLCSDDDRLPVDCSDYRVGKAQGPTPQRSKRRARHRSTNLTLLESNGDLG